jgi:hypothetical protein
MMLGTTPMAAPAQVSVRNYLTRRGAHERLLPGPEALSACHGVDDPNDQPNCFEEGGPDHEACDDLHEKPEGD